MTRTQENLLFTATMLIVLFMLVGLFLGTIRGLALSSNDHGKQCSYPNIMSRINLGYVIGCELTEPRWAPKQ